MHACDAHPGSLAAVTRVNTDAQQAALPVRAVQVDLEKWVPDHSYDTIAAIGPIAKTSANREKLEAIYNLIKYNSRVRHLLSASLRRPWEKTYRGEQRHALDYDRDFLAVIEEEFLQQRLLLLLEKEKRPLRLQDLAGSLHEDEVQVADCLWNLVTDGTINLTHQKREAFFCSPA